VLSKLTGAQVEGAVLDVEQPRVSIEFLGGDRDSRLAPGELDHRGELAGGLGSESVFAEPLS
jgi:hypothetical protein